MLQRMIYLAASMMLSQASESFCDSLSDVLGALGASVARHTRMEAGGRWALAFPAIDRFKFVTVVRGSAWILLPGRDPEHLSAGDVCVLGRIAYVVASHTDEAPVDGRTFYADGRDVARLGGDETIAVGGAVTFATVHADFLLDMLPPCMVVHRSSPVTRSVAIILDLIDQELARDAMGRATVTARLGDLLLVEAMRAYAAGATPDSIGWLAALADPRLGRALRAMHRDVAQPWTVARLATLAGMSRAAFSADFSRRVGLPPLTYLRSWRLALARTALARGDASVASVGADVGYVSQSAFASAYRRAFGVPPTRRL